MTAPAPAPGNNATRLDSLSAVHPERLAAREQTQTLVPALTPAPKEATENRTAGVPFSLSHPAHAPTVLPPTPTAAEVFLFSLSVRICIFVLQSKVSSLVSA